MGKLIVIEGLDGCGKATQTEILYDYVQKRNQQVRKLSFPMYDSESSILLKMYLNGKFGKNPNDVNAYAASTFFAVDRYASYMMDWKEDYNAGATILCDRYTMSNVIHQLPKLPKNDWKSYIDWLYTFEFDLLGIPKPDGVIFLNCDVETSQRLMSNRYNNDETKKDIHEANIDYLKHCHEVSDYLIDQLGWYNIDCVNHNNQELRKIVDISEDVQKVYEKIINMRC